EAADLPWRAITATPEEPYPFVTALAEARPDVLLAFDWQANLLGARHWRHCGAGIFVWNQRDAGGFGPVAPLRGAAALTPCFLSNSVHACEYLIDSLGVSRDRIAIVKNEVTLPPPER